MKIKKILSRNRRDFEAMYECESCGFEEKARGYDDFHFHNNVVPLMKCFECGAKAPSDYQPRHPLYGEDEVV